jgi:hypothetical protein
MFGSYQSQSSSIPYLKQKRVHGEFFDTHWWPSLAFPRKEAKMVDRYPWR